MRTARALALSSCLAFGVLEAQPLGGEFRVNTYTSGDQDSPGVGLDSAGNFVVAWRAHGPIGEYNGPRVQRYSANGSTVGGEFKASGITYYFTNGGTAVASDPSGGFVVVWSDFAAGNDSELGVFGQRFDGAGSPLGGIFHANTYTTSNQSQPRIAMNGTGDFVVVWDSLGEDGSVDSVFARRYAPDASPLGEPFLVNTYTTGTQARASAAIGPSGDFVVVWQSPIDAANISVFGQRFAASGARLGPEFRVNVHTSGYSGEPAVASTAAGGFVVVWRSTYGASLSNDILARPFDAGGVPLGPEFRVNQTTSTYMDLPSIGALGSTGFVVTWNSGGKDALVFGRLLSTLATPLADEFAVSTNTAGQNFSGSVAGLQGRNYVVTWSNKPEDGDGRGVYARRFHARSNGDANGDGSVDIADVFYLINFLFASGPGPIGPADVNGDLTTDIADVFYLINALFAGGPAPV
jgi:hypothetical protein